MPDRVVLGDGTPLLSMDLGSIDLPANADVIIYAKNSPDHTPVLFATTK